MSENNVYTNPPEVKDMNLFNRIIGVFVSPGATFNAIAAKPKWIIPGIILYVLTLGYSYYVQPITLAETSEIKEKMYNKMNVPAEKRQQAREKDKELANKKFVFIGKTTFGFVFAIAALSAILLFIANIIVGGKASFNQLLAVYIYSSFIPAIGNLIKLPLILSKETLNVHFSIATFLPETMKYKFIYVFLAQLDLFNIWLIICLCIGVALTVKKNIMSIWPWITLLYLIMFAGASAIASFFIG